MDKKIIFRADGNSKTGLGHLYRLFALIEIYKKKNDFVVLTRENTVLDVIPYDYAIKIIPNAIKINEEPLWIQSNFSSDEYIIIADGYHFVSSYQKKIKEFGFFLMYIDDLAKEHMYADIVVNHSPHAFENDFSKQDYTKLALGTKYALLRPSFLNKAKRNKIFEKMDTVFVCFGGADENNFTYRCVLELLEISEIKKINVVVGGAYSFLEVFEIEKKYDRVEIFSNLNEKKLFALMNSCNIAIAPTSTILFELISVNMYLVSGYYVENQRKAYIELLSRNVFTGIGDFNKYQFDFLGNHLLSLSNKQIRKQIDFQNDLIDGNQKKRFLALIN